MANDEKQKMLELFDNKRADKYPLDKYDSIGKRGVRRTDGHEKASGAAKYTVDVQLPGMLYGRFLTSPYPHAEIVSMDTSEAEKLPGVRYILRYDDPELPEGASLGGHELNSVPPLPRIAHFQGEEVGAFAVADSEEIAEEALRLIRVEWKQRPFVLDMEKALEPGAPLWNPESHPEGNLDLRGVQIEDHGDVEKGFAEADKIIDFKFTFGLNTWAGPERPCGVWRWNGDFAEVLRNYSGDNLPYHGLATNHLNCYVTARLYWDADQDVNGAVTFTLPDFQGSIALKLMAPIPKPPEK